MGAILSIEVHPVQTIDRKGGKLPKAVTLAAYEVYSYVYGTQEGMINGNCRGGFSISEIIAFLYARPFPKEEWRARVYSAFKGMEHIS